MGYGTHYTRNGGRLYYLIGKKNPGVYLELNGNVVTVLHHEMYGPNKIINLGKGEYLIGELGKNWIFNESTSDLKRMNYLCNPVGYVKDKGYLICHDDKNKKLMVREKNGKVIDTCVLGQYVYPVSYMNELGAVLATKGKMGLSLRHGIYQKDEVLLLRLFRGERCEMYETGVDKRIVKNGIAVIE